MPALDHGAPADPGLEAAADEAKKAADACSDPDPYLAATSAIEKLVAKLDRRPAPAASRMPVEAAMLAVSILATRAEHQARKLDAWRVEMNRVLFRRGAQNRAAGIERPK